MPHFIMALRLKIYQTYYLHTWDIFWFWEWSKPLGTGATWATGAVIGLTADMSGGTRILAAGEGILCTVPGTIPEPALGVWEFTCWVWFGNCIWVELYCWFACTLWELLSRGESPLADLPSMGFDVTLLSLELLSNGRHWRALRLLNLEKSSKSYPFLFFWYIDLTDYYILVWNLQIKYLLLHFCGGMSKWAIFASWTRTVKRQISTHTSLISWVMLPHSTDRCSTNFRGWTGPIRRIWYIGSAGRTIIISTSSIVAVLSDERQKSSNDLFSGIQGIIQ